jgi:hypothetical protein
MVWPVFVFSYIFKRKKTYIYQVTIQFPNSSLHSGQKAFEDLESNMGKTFVQHELDLDWACLTLPWF